jgi:hypothetical protein
MRFRAAPSEYAVLAALAAVVVLGAGLGAWQLASGELKTSALPPVLGGGVIGVAIEAPAGSPELPIEVEADYSSAPGDPETDLFLTFTQTGTAGVAESAPPEILVLLCGAIARHPSFTSGALRPVRWHVPVSPDGNPYSAVFGFLDQCVYTVLTMQAETAPALSGTRGALISGSSGFVSSEISGTQAVYALPGVVDGLFPVPIDGLKPTAMPSGSTLTVGGGAPDDLENVLSTPQLANAGDMTWTSAMSTAALPVSQYRIEGDVGSLEDEQELHLFVAGALVGVAGGALIWLLQLAGSRVYRAISAQAPPPPRTAAAPITRARLVRRRSAGPKWLRHRQRSSRDSGRET